MSIWRLERRSHRVDGVHAELHEILLAHLRVRAAWSSSICVLRRVRHACVIDLSRGGTIAQSHLTILLRDVSTSRFWNQIMLLLLLLLKIRRNVERLNPAVVLGLYLLLESPLSLMSLVDLPITCHTPSADRIIQETFGTHISVLKFILNV